MCVHKMMSGLRSATSNETKITRNKLKNKTTNKIEKSKNNNYRFCQV